MCSPRLDIASLTATARQLSMRGEYRDSLRIMDRVRRRATFVTEDEHLRLIYPLAFRYEVEQAARDYRLPRHLFYALLREESYFAPAVVSPVGAVGLSQLMPATAQEVSRRIGIASPDLTDPRANLAIGGAFLREMLDRFEGEPILALAAYNAGASRVRRWRRRNSDFSWLLFAEAIPFEETRHYIRKITVSTAGYAKLYGDQPPHRVVQQFFPDLDQWH